MSADVEADLTERWLRFLHDEVDALPASAPTDGCFVMTATTYARVGQLKRLREELAQRQLASAKFRESLALQIGARIGRYLFRRPDPGDELDELRERVAQMERQLRDEVSPLEMADASFCQYRPWGDVYLRVPSTRLRELAPVFFAWSGPSEVTAVLERFGRLREIFAEYPPDPRVLGFVALLAARHPDFEAETFFTWDERLLRMIYGRNASSTHPLTFDRFLVHATLYALPWGAIRDRYLGFRIGWDQFRSEWSRHFRHQLRALVSAARLLWHVEPFPANEEAFQEFYRRKLGRYRQFLHSLHRRARTADAQMGRGLNAQGLEMDFDIRAPEGGVGGEVSVSQGISLGGDAHIGLPDPIFGIIARLASKPLPVEEGYRQFAEMMLALDFLNEPALVASILADSPLYYRDRQDEHHPFERRQPGQFAQRLRERFQQATRQEAPFGLTPIHAALVALQPGSVEASVAVLAEIAHHLDPLPEPAQRLVSFLLLDGARPMSRNAHFSYELWLAEGHA